MRLDEFDYVLPEELIAQEPAVRRDASRLLLLDRQSGAVSHTDFSRIADRFREGDLLVINTTRVIPARLLGRKESGGKVELFLVVLLVQALLVIMVIIPLFLEQD